MLARRRTVRDEAIGQRERGCAVVVMTPCARLELSHTLSAVCRITTVACGLNREQKDEQRI
jgi:hypothetical protein